MIGLAHPRAETAASVKPEVNIASGLSRFLTLLMDGASRSMPELDTDAHKVLVNTANALALQTPDHLPDADKLAQIQAFLSQLKQYGKSVEEQIRGRQYEWRIITAALLRELEERLGFDASEMELRIGDLENTSDLQRYRKDLEEFLHPDLSGPQDDPEMGFHTTDRSTDNTNASGLRGGGAAVLHVKHIMDRNGRGYVAMIRLGCLEMISERFGPEAVEDCQMAVSAYLTAALHREDQIYHWTDAMLLAVIEDRVNEKILHAELTRIVMQNREITVNIGGRMVMLRIPLEFEITPTRAFSDPEDLFKLSMHETKAW